MKWVRVASNRKQRRAEKAKRRKEPRPVTPSDVVAAVKAAGEWMRGMAVNMDWSLCDTVRLRPPTEPSEASPRG